MKNYLYFLCYMTAIYVNYFAFPHFAKFEVLRLLCVFFLIFEFLNEHSFVHSPFHR